MPLTIACKLPHGLTITHNGQTINLNGANLDYDPMNPARNGILADGGAMSGGYGLTTLDGDQADAFTDWADKATKDKDGKQLVEPFLPLTNGSIIVAKSEADARKETQSVTTQVSTGFDGLDGDAEIRAATEGTGLVDSGEDKPTRKGR